MMAQFKAMLKSFDKEGYSLALKKQQEKIDLYNQALEWSAKYVDVGDPMVSGLDYEVFEKDMITEFKRALLEKQKQNIQIPISADKLIYMMDIPMPELHRIADKYYENKSSVNLTGGKMTGSIDRKKYQTFTKSEKEKVKLRIANKFIEALEQVSVETQVYPHQIQRATNNFIAYDYRTNKYKANIY